MSGGPIKGRGASSNPANRFEEIVFAPGDDEDAFEEVRPLRTQFLRDASQTIITCNDSPDIPFNASINPYRGCEHGCAYCYARPTHEYLGFSAGLDFETRIMVKEEAPNLLRRELASPRWKPQVLAISGVTDCYQPIERKLRLTRGCLEVLVEFRNPVSLITKNYLVTRDIDLLSELAPHNAVSVGLSINSLDSRLTRRLEPRASLPEARLAAVGQLAKAGISVGVMVAPIIPGLNDHEIPSVLKAAREAGAQWAGSEILRLPLTVAPLFLQWLEENEPQKKSRILAQIHSIRGGKLNDARFGVRMRGQGIFAEQIARMFEVAARKAGFSKDSRELSATAFRRPGEAQLELGLPVCQNAGSRGTKAQS